VSDASRAYSDRVAKLLAAINPFIKKEREIRKRFAVTHRTLLTERQSLTESLAFIFPPSFGLSWKSPPVLVQAKLKTINALLLSVFQLVPHFAFQSRPIGIYQAALALRRFAESTDPPPIDFGDLSRDVTGEELDAGQRQVGRFWESENRLHELEDIVEHSVEHSILAQLFDSLFGMTSDNFDDDVLIDHMQALEMKLRLVKQRELAFTQYTDHVMALLNGLGAAIPSTLDSLVHELRHPKFLSAEAMGRVSRPKKPAAPDS
jgi:hypothetical protein